MKLAFVKWVSRLCAGVFLIGAGCVGPHYSEHQLVLYGKDAPLIRGPRDPAIARHLTTNLWAKSNFPDRAAEVGVTPFKAMGVQGWKDFHLHARARGHVMQHEVSSNGFRTVDLRLESLTVDNVRVHWKGTRFMRVEIFLGKVRWNRPSWTTPMRCCASKASWFGTRTVGLKFIRNAAATFVRNPHARGGAGGELQRRFVASAVSLPRIDQIARTDARLADELRKKIKDFKRHPPFAFSISILFRHRPVCFRQANAPLEFGNIGFFNE